VEDRIEAGYTERQGFALIALVVIIAVTAAWWALALWPTGVEPEWLVRTRAACFGSARGGLPNSGGWILLIGEPIGMFGALVVLWGRSLSRDLSWLRARGWGRVSLAIMTTGIVIAGGALAFRVAGALPSGEEFPVNMRGIPLKVDRPAPIFSLVDQHGARVSFADFRGSRVLVTYAFGHCTTMCPAIVSDLKAARRTANREDLPIVVITLDPWRDAPEQLPKIVQHWQLGRRDRVLSGSIPEVERALDELGIARRRNLTTGDIEHTSTVMLLDEQGSIAWRVDGAPLSGEELRIQD
jgi:cytochrome oxidase Cu insertion factor (SCO1/SenC/PrrC family)